MLCEYLMNVLMKPRLPYQIEDNLIEDWHLFLFATKKEKSNASKNVAQSYHLTYFKLE